MANVIPSRPRSALAQRRNFAVVASQYNREFVDGLVEGFRNELAIIAPAVTITVFEVPGAFEIPIAAVELATRGGYDVITVFGVILQGATLHADLISRAVTDGIMRIALQHRVPIIHEVLVVQNEEQARERCLGSELNRGVEAARAAVQIVQTLTEIRGR